MGYSEIKQESARAVGRLLEGKTFTEKMALYRKKRAELARAIEGEEARMGRIVLKEAESMGLGREDGFNFNPENPLRNYLSAGRLMEIIKCKERQERAFLEAALIAERIIIGHAKSLGAERIPELRKARSEGIAMAKELSKDIDTNKDSVNRFLLKVETEFRRLGKKRRAEKASGKMPEPKGPKVKKFTPRRR